MLYKFFRCVVGFTIVIFFISGSHLVFAENSKLQNQTSVQSQVNNPTSSHPESVNINSVDAAALQKIKGMSKRKAQAIIDYRTKHGPFKSLEELLQVKCRGIHKNWLDRVKKYLTL